MHIVINGESRNVEHRCTLVELVAAHADSGRPFAIALNGEFVPRMQYESRQVNDGDNIEIVSPVGGG